MQPYLTDAALQTVTALPAAAGAVTGNATDLMNGQFGDQDQRMEWEIQAPALNTTQLPNAATVNYAVMMSNSNTMANAVLIYDNVIQQVGAGGTGAAAVIARFRLPFQPGGLNAAMRYLAIRATTATLPGNCAAASMTLLPRF